MGGLGSILASLAAGNAAAFAHRMKRNAVLYAVILLFVLTAYVLAVASLAIYLGQMWGMPIGLLVVAAGALVLAVFIYLCVMLADRAAERRRREAAAADTQKAMMVTAALTAVPSIIKSKPLMAVAVAAGVAFLATKVAAPGSSSSDDA
jgi:heme/copper-type cytochrome/quinol oxidase subunit 2